MFLKQQQVVPLNPICIKKKKKKKFLKQQQVVPLNPICIKKKFLKQQQVVPLNPICIKKKPFTKKLSICNLTLPSKWTGFPQTRRWGTPGARRKAACNGCWGARHWTRARYPSAGSSSCSSAPRQRGWRSKGGWFWWTLPWWGHTGPLIPATQIGSFSNNVFLKIKSLKKKKKKEEMWPYEVLQYFSILFGNS